MIPAVLNNDRELCYDPHLFAFKHIGVSCCQHTLRYSFVAFLNYELEHSLCIKSFFFLEP